MSSASEKNSNTVVPHRANRAGSASGASAPALALARGEALEARVQRGEHFDDGPDVVVGHAVQQVLAHRLLVQFRGGQDRFDALGGQARVVAAPVDGRGDALDP